MKILLITHPVRRWARLDFFVPPLGLAYLAPMLERNGHRVKIIDALALGWNWSSFAAQIKREKADLIGIGSMISNMEDARRAVTLCRPHTQYLVMGGPYLSALNQEIFKECPELDFGIAGEGEFSFPALVRKLDKGEAPGDVPGLVTPDRFNPPGSLIEDLDSLPFPARHLLPNHRYYYPSFPGRRVTSLITSRGCPYGCIFCSKSVTGSAWRGRTPRNVVDEIEECAKDQNIRTFSIYDPVFSLDKQRAIEICQGILDRGLKVEWKCRARVDNVDEETLVWMKKAGCAVIAYGIESGHQAGLDYLQKGFTLSQARRTCEMTRRLGIKLVGHFIVGLPVETIAQGMKTIEFARELKTDSGIFGPLRPYKGTKLYEEAKAKGWYQETEKFSGPTVLSENWPADTLREILVAADRELSRIPIVPGNGSED